jgi:hypothetical protein
MPDTAEHRADMYRLATERRAAGKPIWDGKLKLADVFHNDSLSFEEKRDAIVRRIRASRWFKDYDEFDDLPLFVEELADTEDNGSFNAVWSEIYDIADADRVWIENR